MEVSSNAQAATLLNSLHLKRSDLALERLNDEDRNKSLKTSVPSSLQRRSAGSCAVRIEHGNAASARRHQKRTDAHGDVRLIEQVADQDQVCFRGRVEQILAAHHDGHAVERRVCRRSSAGQRIGIVGDDLPRACHHRSNR